METENAKLKRLLADAILDNAALKELLEKMVTPAAGSEAVALNTWRWDYNAERPHSILRLADAVGFRGSLAAPVLATGQAALAI